MEPATPALSVAADATAPGVRRVLWITLFLNLAVSGAKIAVGWLSGSMAMVADGYHSMVDGANNVVGLVVASFAYAPPDAGHPYGHRKFETAATSIIATALLGLAYEVVVGALGRASHAQLPVIGGLNWVVMLLTLAVNVYVSWYEAREGHRLGSSYLVADAAHTRSDIYVSLGVFASFAGARAGLPWADAAVALGIAAVIAFQAVRIIVPAFHVLTDRAVLPAAPIVTVVEAVPGVVRCSQVRTRGGTGAVYVDLIVHVDGAMTLREAHTVADAVEAALAKAHPIIADVVVHVEPA